MNKESIHVRKSHVFVLICFIATCTSSFHLLENRILADNSTNLQPSKAASSYDWRDFTTITPVKKQGDCNAYYAFSTIAFFEQDLILY